MGTPIKTKSPGISKLNLKWRKKQPIAKKYQNSKGTEIKNEKLIKQTQPLWLTQNKTPFGLSGRFKTLR